MAISAGAHAVLFRGNASDASPVTAETAADAEKVEFDHVLIGVDTWDWAIDRFRPNIPDPEAEAPRAPDSGLNKLKVMLRCSVRRYDMGLDPASRSWHPLDRILRWGARTMTINGKYEEGRYGLWFWHDEILSHAPVRGAGYKINSVKRAGTGQMPSTTGIEIELEFSGAVIEHDGLGVSPTDNT